MPSKPVLSDDDKRCIRKKMEELCEHCWTTQGYKKTNIKELCSAIGISVGTFYTLYPAKEDIFFDTILGIQNKLAEKLFVLCRSAPSKEGFTNSLKTLFREYDSKPFLYQFSSLDFQSFITKLPPEAMAKIKFDSIEFFRTCIRITGLTLKIDEYEAYGILSALLSTINAKETLSLSCDYLAVFDFMAEHLVSEIFE